MAFFNGVGVKHGVSVREVRGDPGALAGCGQAHGEDDGGFAIGQGASWAVSVARCR